MTTREIAAEPADHVRDAYAEVRARAAALLG